MEIPNEIKSLYRHWSTHTVEMGYGGTIPDIPEELSWFVDERIRIWEKKARNEPSPYTTDKVLAFYRFCNIFREFDRQTIEFHTLLNPLRENLPLWLLNMFYARMVARTKTIENVGLLSFDEKHNKELYGRLIASSRPRFGTPYVFPISAIQRSDTPTRERFITEHLPRAMRAIADEIGSWEKLSVEEGVARALPLFGFNLSFLWTEVLIDTAYQFPRRIDLFKRFPIGPGSLPTFRNIAEGHDPVQFVETLSEARVPTEVTYDGRPLALSAENWEGIGCEFRKYTNLRQGKGRRRIYRPE